MAFERVTDHVEQGLKLLISQYKGKPRLRAWLTSYLRQVQLLQDAVWDVLEKRWLDNATGPELLTIGRIVGEPYGDQDTETYRALIRVRIRINRSLGRAEDVLTILRLLDSTTEYQFDEVRVCNMIIEFADQPVIALADIYSRLVQTKGGGVGLHLIAPTVAPEDSFSFCDESEQDEDSVQGFSDEADETTGGALADVQTTTA